MSAKQSKNIVRPYGDATGDGVLELGLKGRYPCFVLPLRLGDFG